MSKQHWTAYWKTGVLTSLPVDFKENYDGELAAYWENALLDAGCDSLDVLDLCTGNGAIAILLAELASKNNIHVNITAVDASDINPGIIAKTFPSKKGWLGQIKFIGQCLVEQLTSTVKQKFDLVVSQYGLEYCDEKLAAPEIYQVLKPGGRLLFVAHSPDTAMLKYMREEEAVYQLLESVNLLEAFSRFGADQLSCNGFKTKLNHALTSMQPMIEYRQQNLFRAWGDAAYKLSQMPNTTLKMQRKEVKGFVLQYQHARQRSQDMIGVSEKLMNSPNWYKTFIEHHLQLESEGVITYQQLHNVGHYYQFKKSID